MNISLIENNLRGAIAGEVRFDPGTRAIYATDSSNYRQAPIGVVIPKSIDDVIATVAVARRYEAPILNRGGGTSLAGQCCNVAIVMDMSKYLDKILEIDPVKKLARVQPGVILDSLRDAAERHHLTFGPDPATHNHCTLGGMIGNNSCGVHSVMSGKTDNNIHDLEILTYRGERLRVGLTSDKEYEEIVKRGGAPAEIYLKLRGLRDKYADLIRARFPKIPRCVSGFNLPALLPENGFNIARALVGSESACVTVLEATLNLVHSPPGRSLVVLGYPDVFRAADHIMEILERKPIALEAFDDFMVQGMYKKNLHTEKIALLPQGGGWLLIEFGADTKAEADEKSREFIASLKTRSDAPNAKLFDDKIEAAKVWKVRESALGAVSHVPGQKHTYEGWEDSAVPPAAMGKYLRDLKQLYKAYEYQGALYGHVGDGCIHTRITFDFSSKEGIQKFRRFVFDAADLVIKYGGSVSGEHGDGQSRGELLPKMYGEELVQAFREFKSIWDPDWKMNPGKLIDPYRIDENLRINDQLTARPLETNFSFSNDEGSFAHAANRCVGVGECRRDHGGTMCPSYRVTHEEKHSTRGRARALWEMIYGDLLRNAWHEEAVKESLDLCLSCKGCKTDCPVQVDMAMYKAEFLSHYYEGKIRPVTAYSFGMIDKWARMASILPGIANFFTQTPGLRDVVKSMTGIAPERAVPKFAKQPFRKWFTKRPVVNADKPQVVLWPDTFNNFFHPQVAIDAVEVLEYAGFRVVIPAKTLCCGRPLYDHGMLARAKKLIEETVSVLHPHIVAGTPMVGLEPSCIAVFRDEMGQMLPGNGDAEKLSKQVFTLSEFLERENLTGKFPNYPKKVLYHGHCHQKAVMGTNAEQRVLSALGADAAMLDSGCCGMAGSFGFAKEHYEISQQVGELSLLPAVRNAADDTVVIADGFSCHEQIVQGTGKKPLHLAELLRQSIR